MNKIHFLSEEVISKIAAGEVIERPAFAVKELIENAIDAGASTISITVEDGGLKKIEVLDDGEGMNPEDVLTCFKLHATSKITRSEELFSLGSLGFRGEALSSITSVSATRIKSRFVTSNVGTQVLVKDGVLQESQSIGMPVGTHVVVENIFESTPARKKFLKSARGEFARILDIITRYSLSHPHVGFSVLHNGKHILLVPKEQTVEQRLRNVLGNDLMNASVVFAGEESYLKIGGFTARPYVTSPTGGNQYLFVNGRSVRDQGISLAVKQAYGPMLDSNSQPTFVLFLTVPSEYIDVNVHPRKEIVSFSEPQFVFDTVKQIVSQTLHEENITYPNVSWQAEVVGSGDGVVLRRGSTQTAVGNLLREEVLPAEVTDLVSSQKLAVLVQIHALYILEETPVGLHIYDQHAAHERVLYEQLKKTFTKKQKNQDLVTLVSPIPLSLPPKQTLALEHALDDLALLGVAVEPIGANQFVVTKLPELLKDQHVPAMISEMLEDLESQSHVREFGSQTDRMLKYLACRAAVKAGDYLTVEQMKNLLVQWKEAPNNATCPHGRPVQVQLSLSQIHKLFKR